MVFDVDISKVLGGPKPIVGIKEDPDTKRAKQVVILFCLVIILTIVICAIIFSVIAGNLETNLARAQDDLAATKLSVAKFKKSEQQAKDIARRSSAIEQILASKPYWSGFFDELSEITPKNVVYSGFQAGDENIDLAIEGILGLAPGSFGESLENLISINGADNFIRVFKLDVNKDLFSAGADEAMKARKLIEEMKKGEFWGAANIAAVSSADANLGIAPGTIKQLLQGEITMNDFAQIVSRVIAVENSIKIDGKTDSYKSLATLIASLEESGLFEKVTLGGATLVQKEKGELEVTFSLVVVPSISLRAFEAMSGEETSIIPFVPEAPEAPEAEAPTIVPPMGE